MRNANEWRMAHGLEPITTGKTERSKEKNRRRLANLATRAQECRDIKNRRTSGKKGK